MAKHDLSDLEASFDEVVAGLPDTFDAHRFLQGLSREHQALYIEALHAYRHSMSEGRPTAFRTLHAELSKRLKRRRDLVEHVDDIESADIFGNRTSCALYRKIGA